MSLAGQFSAVYAHEGYDLFKFVGKFLFPSLVILIKGSENLEKERERNYRDFSFFLPKGLIPASYSRNGGYLSLR